MEQKQQQTNRLPKIIWTIVLIALTALLIYFIFARTSGGQKISVDTFYVQLQNEKISKVELNSNKVNITYKNGQKAWFYTRSAIEEQLTQDITEYNLNNPESAVQLVTGTTSAISISSILMFVLYAVAIIVFIFWFTRQIRGANSKSFDFVKNRARIAESRVRFSDVAGAEEEKQEVAEIVEFLKNPQKFKDIGARVPKGVLLVGPPGTGKTLLAKAIAGEAGVPFFTISGSDFMELFVGVGASRVRDLFAQAQKMRPCIVFIDEIDAIGRQRGAGVGGGNDEREQTLNQLLVQMDGFEPNTGIIVLAATNRADILDPALMRPGRFDRQIYIHAPDVRGREEILKVHSRGKKLAKNVDFSQIARITSGFTGADLENLLNEAAILAARENRNEITMKDISDGIDKVILGPQKKSWVMTDHDKERTAYHEAGHAIVQHYIENNEPIHEVSIIPRGSAAGYTLSRPKDDDKHVTKNKLIDQICMLLGGRVSEKLFLSDISTGASNDIERATEIARAMVTKWGMSEKLGLVCFESERELFLGRDYQSRAVYSETKATEIDNEIAKIIAECEKKTAQIIQKHKKEIGILSKTLIEKETLYEDEINLVFEGKTQKAIIKYIDQKHEKENQVKKEEEKQEVKQEFEKIEKPTIEENASKNVEVKNIEKKLVEEEKNQEEKEQNNPKTKNKKTVIINKDDEEIPENIEDVISGKKKKDTNK